MLNLAISFLTMSNLSWFHTPKIPGSCAILFSTASDFTFTTRSIQIWVLFPLCSSCFILSAAISNWPLLFASRILDIFWPGELLFQCHNFLLFIVSMWFFRQGYCIGLPFLPLVYWILSEFFSMICSSWVSLHGMAYSFIELHKPLNHSKAVIHEGVIYMARNINVFLSLSGSKFLSEYFLSKRYFYPKGILVLAVNQNTFLCIPYVWL